MTATDAWPSTLSARGRCGKLRCLIRPIREGDRDGGERKSFRRHLIVDAGQQGFALAYSYRSHVFQSKRGPHPDEGSSSYLNAFRPMAKLPFGS